MKIGEALKKKRKELGLTQTEMVGNVLTKSYYSKIERGIHEINAVDLMKILNLHDISVSNFFEEIKQSESNNNLKIRNYLRQLHEAYYHKNLRKIIQLKYALRNEKNKSDEILDLEANAELIEANFTGNLKLISEDDVKRIKNRIFKTENWTEDELRLLAIAMPIFNIDELNFIISSIFDRYKNINELSNSLREKISAIAVNFLEYSYRCQNGKNKYTEKAIKVLDTLDEEPKNCFAKIMEQYYKNLFDDNKEKAQNIINFLYQNGLKDLTKNIESQK